MVRIAIIACNESEEIEVIVPSDLWRRADFKVDIISLEKKNTIILQNGLKISCDNTIDKSNLNQYSAIYLPGGSGHRKYFLEAWPTKNNDGVSKLHKFIAKFLDTPGKFVFALCAAPSFLNKMNFIDDKKFTCYPGFEKNYEKKYVNTNVLKDGNLITGRAPGSVFEFSYKVIEELSTQDNATKVKDEICDFYPTMPK